MSAARRRGLVPSASRTMPPFVKTKGRSAGPIGPQRLGDHLLGMPVAVDGGRVDPVHPALHGVADRGDAFGIVLRSPHVAADRPGTEAGAGNLHPCPPEGASRQVCLHVVLPLRGQPAEATGLLWLRPGCRSQIRAPRDLCGSITHFVPARRAGAGCDHVARGCTLVTDTGGHRANAWISMTCRRLATGVG